MQIRISENGITLYASVSHGTIFVEMLILEWQHPIGPCQWKIDRSGPIAEAWTQLSKGLVQIDSNPHAERERQAVMARALTLLNWVETVPQLIPVTILLPRHDPEERLTIKQQAGFAGDISGQFRDELHREPPPTI